MTTIGLIHPGAMGAAIGRALVERGNSVLWCSESRSEATRRRAEQAGLTEVTRLEELAAQSETIMCVCPPESAATMAETVAGLRFGGCYVDTNAISTSTARTIAETVLGGGASFVDGSIVGPPPAIGGSTRLYLSGEQAANVAIHFDGSSFGVIVLGAEIGTASALKACYAGWAKGTSALLLAVQTVARSYGVEDALLAEWLISQPELEARSVQAASEDAPKAWRFVSEMQEHARTFAQVGVTGTFHEAAADVFGRLAEFTDTKGVTLAQAMAAIARPSPR
jgi:3-hydroxyisobutyrate dehydrogenase-like beta-hydroxyacid dehydrogenase